MKVRNCGTGRLMGGQRRAGKKLDQRAGAAIAVPLPNPTRPKPGSFTAGCRRSRPATRPKKLTSTRRGVAVGVARREARLGPAQAAAFRRSTSRLRPWFARDPRGQRAPRGLPGGEEQSENSDEHLARAGAHGRTSYEVPVTLA